MRARNVPAIVAVIVGVRRSAILAIDPADPFGVLDGTRLRDMRPGRRELVAVHVRIGTAT
jgi:hypothetical protein